MSISPAIAAEMLCERIPELARERVWLESYMRKHADLFPMDRMGEICSHLESVAADARTKWRTDAEKKAAKMVAPYLADFTARALREHIKEIARQTRGAKS